MDNVKMIDSIAESYSKYLDTDLDERFTHMDKDINHLLVRLEEFQMMVTMIQKEQCEANSFFSSMVESKELQLSLNSLIGRVDNLEDLMKYLKESLGLVEARLETAEEQFGLADNTNKLKHFFLPLFKKQELRTSSSNTQPLENISVEKYFINEEEIQEI